MGRKSTAQPLFLRQDGQVLGKRGVCKLELRTAVSPRDVKHYTTQRLREEFLIQDLFVPGQIKLVYSHIDRIITGAAVPVEPIALTAGEELRAEIGRAHV